MFKFATVAKLAATAAAAILTLQAAPASARRSHDGFDRHVVVYNESGQSILEVHGTPTTYQSYGPDLIPDFVIEDGDHANVNFDVGNGACRYDLRAKMADGSTVDRRNVNVCRITRWTVGG